MCSRKFMNIPQMSKNFVARLSPDDSPIKYGPYRINEDERILGDFHVLQPSQTNRSSRIYTENVRLHQNSSYEARLNEGIALIASLFENSQGWRHWFAKTSPVWRKTSIGIWKITRRKSFPCSGINSRKNLSIWQPWTMTWLMKIRTDESWQLFLYMNYLIYV